MAPHPPVSATSKSASLSPNNPSTMAKNAQLSLKDLERIAEKVLKFSAADETEVDVGSGTDALTRFANNTIHQNVAEHTLGISVRAVVDGRTARATTNKTDDESLRRAVAAAATLARNQPRNPDLLPLIGRQKYQKVSRFFSSTAGTTPEDRAKAVTRVCKMANKAKQTAAGIFSSGEYRSVMANSRGLVAQYEQTRAEFSITILEANSSGWAKSNSPDIRKIDPQELAENASGVNGRALARAARSSRRPLHHDPEPERRARPGRLSFLRFRRHLGARQTFLPHRPHRQESFRRQHHHLGRRLSSAAERPAARRGRRPAPESSAGRQGRAEESGLLARHREKNEGQAHRPRILAAERIRRSADESDFLRRHSFHGGNDPSPPSAAFWSRAFGTSAKSIPTKRSSPA